MTLTGDDGRQFGEMAVGERPCWSWCCRANREDREDVMDGCDVMDG
jgi:hypothetical protein